MKGHLLIGDHPIPVDELARVMVSREPAILADDVVLVPATVLLTVDLTYGEFTEIRWGTPDWVAMVDQLIEIFPRQWPAGSTEFEDAADALADGEYRTLWQR